ncbi:MAG: AAA family ATPase, partial [Deltaproteobacteria bacterium]|nr:AAA family ATPase [Deltaproteobacteria bacterium]
MRILELRFKNLNSLYGEWSIDFTTPGYVFDGIFAITGPTGAGKSTILDAVCLALYGRTPRLKSITKTSNEIMSRQTGECFAEVTFETMDKKLRSHWSQQKAWKKADGKLGDSRHEISDAVTGRIIESKKRDVALRVEKETGMDFDRFTRSMLLAQGGFAAFLAAVPDKRAPILEQITGTGIYSEISKQVHERFRDESEKLELLRAETFGIIFLSDEDEDALIKEISTKQKLEKELNQKNEALGKSILRLEKINTLKAELSQIDKESKVLSGRVKAFEPDKIKLENALKAAELEGEYAGLQSTRQQQKFDLGALAKAQNLVPDQEKLSGLKEINLKKAKKATAKVKEEQRNEILKIREVRALDFQIAQQKSALETSKSECGKIENRILEEKEQEKKAKSALKLTGKKLFKAEAYLSANAFDSALVTEMTGIK